MSPAQAIVDRVPETVVGWCNNDQHVELSEQSKVYPLIPPGASPMDLIWREVGPQSDEVIRVSDRYDFGAGQLRDLPTLLP